MRRFSSKALSLLLAVVMLVGIIPAALPLSVAAEGTSAPVTVTTGASGVKNFFKEDTYYDIPSIDTPMTYEFELVGCGGIGSDRAGVILGSYGRDKTPCISIELYTYGRIRFYLNEGSVADIVFDTVDARKNDVTHYAITIDPTTNTASIYVNGVFAESKTHKNLKRLPSAAEFPYSLRIGGDHRSGNSNYFKGAVNSVALYSDIRTAEEIALDAKRAKTWSADTDGLMAAYDISRQDELACYDFSGNNRTLTYTNGSGIMVENFGSYNIEKKLEGNPETVEAWIFMPKYYGDRGGTFFGNNGASGSTPDIAFEIEYSGHPRFFYTSNQSGVSGVHEFGKVDMRTGTWQHLTIVHDAANGEARCYINGVLKETLAYTETKDNDNGGKQTPVYEYSSTLNTEYYVFGGDRQTGYLQYFKGFIKELRAYSDVRTASEIASDYAGTLDTADANLLLCYQMSQENVYQDIRDLSGNGYTAVYNQLLWGNVPDIEDYAYSFAVVGDTQNITNSNPARLKDLYQWIIDNKDAKKIQYVMGLGDITELGEDEGHRNYNEEKANAQWTAAKEAITMMDGILPYSLIRGSGHDGVEFFNRYFGNHEGYTSQIKGYYKEGRIENTYHTFTVGDVNYMILCLDFGAKDDVLAWANEVVADHPAHRVIVTTHAYMKKDGSFLAGGQDYAPSQSYYDPSNNDGDDIWNKFVRKHANISMVLCGHLGANDVMVGKQIGDHGNEVTQLLIDPSGMDSSSSPKGMVAMLYFSEDGSEVKVSYHSTLTGMRRPNKEFTVSYGTPEAPDYATLSENYLIAQNKETGLYTIVENTYFQFLGGSLRYGDAVPGYTNIRFGYRFSEDFDLSESNWQWNWGYLDQQSNIKGKEKTSMNVTNLVVTGVPEEYYTTKFNVELVFEITIDGVTYTVTDRVRTRSIEQVATGMAANPAETQAARDYAETILDACKPAA